ncbi:MAG: MOSC and FAD-binding oxidoreductase domain-containing protein [Propionibacteriaceae bacterium]
MAILNAVVDAPPEAVQTKSTAMSGRLLAVSVGLPHDVQWQGRTVHTGVWKRPVSGPQIVRRLNLDGDGQGDLGGHGGPHRAVLVYQTDSYRHWAEHFGRDDLEYGNFGENFTVDGLGDDQVRIGDQFSIGTALFEVSQPRVTCYRVGMRLGEPQLAALLVAHHRPGFYCRVLREGVVEAGDVISRVASDPEAMTVAEVDALLYLPGHDRDAIARALAMRALSPGWQGSFEAMLKAPEAVGNVGLVEQASAPPAWPGFRPARVLELVHESATVVSVRLADVDGQPLPAPLPGQFVALRLPVGGPSSSVIRSYSLSGPPTGGSYRVSVKLEPHGVASGYVVHGLASGAVVDMAAPRGAFTLADGDGPVLLVSAGIGATPVLAMLYALASGSSTRQIWWLHGARNSAEHPFAAEVAALLDHLPGAHRLIAYSHPLPDDVRGVQYDVAGRLTFELLQTLDLPPDATAYVCGPDLFMSELRDTLVRLGVDASRVHSETFGAGPGFTPGIAAQSTRPPHLPAGPPGTGPAVVFARSGLTVPWSDRASSLLELSEACDVPVRWSCRTGVCHSCESGLLAGSVSYSPDPIDLPGTGNVLICCSRPENDVVLDL